MYKQANSNSWTQHSQSSAKFFNSLNEDDLKNFLLYFNIDKFIEITKSKHFSSTWFFNKFTNENSQNEFLIRLLKLDLINNYDNFVNSLKEKTLEIEAKNNFIQVMLRALNNQTRLDLKILYEKLFNKKCDITEKDHIITDIKNTLEYQK